MMRITEKKFTACIFAVLLLFCLSGQVLGMEIKLAHVVNEQDGFHLAAEKFKEIVEDQTDGEISISIYPNAQLGVERTLLEGMQMGTVDMGIITNGPVANFVE
ncbi:MAG: TRAP transporter substrate-binding protein DctP, partial [Desulfonatronovibrionaceae bacterium]